jgi:hypothetical protein
MLAMNSDQEPCADAYRLLVASHKAVVINGFKIPASRALSGGVVCPLRPRRGDHSSERGSSMTKAANLRETKLNQFSGTENWYRHAINRKVLFNDGAKYVADKGGAYWLLDAIAIAQRFEKSAAAGEF